MWIVYSTSAFTHDLIKHHAPTFCMFCFQRIESPLPDCLYSNDMVTDI